MTIVAKVDGVKFEISNLTAEELRTLWDIRKEAGKMADDALGQMLNCIRDGEADEQMELLMGFFSKLYDKALDLISEKSVKTFETVKQIEKKFDATFDSVDVDPNKRVK